MMARHKDRARRPGKEQLTHRQWDAFCRKRRARLAHDQASDKETVTSKEEEDNNDVPSDPEVTLDRGQTTDEDTKVPADPKVPLDRGQASHEDIEANEKEKDADVPCNPKVPTNNKVPANDNSSENVPPDPNPSSTRSTGSNESTRCKSSKTTCPAGGGTSDAKAIVRRLQRPAEQHIPRDQWEALMHRRSARLARGQASDKDTKASNEVDDANVPPDPKVPAVSPPGNDCIISHESPKSATGDELAKSGTSGMALPPPGRE